MEAVKIRAALALKVLCQIFRQIEHHAVGVSVLHQRIGVEIIMLFAVGGVLVIRDLLLPDDHLVVGGVNRAPVGIKRHAVAQIELAVVNIGAVGFIVDLNTIAGGIDRAVVGVGGTLLCHTDTLLHRLTVLVGKVRKPAVKYITRTGRDRQLRDRGALLFGNVGVI